MKEKTDEKKIVIIFHDHNLSGASRALIDLIEYWIEHDSLKLICVLPKKKGEVFDVLNNMPVVILTYPYWQVVRKGGESWAILIKAYLELMFSFVSTIYFGCIKLRRYRPNLIYTNTSVIFEGAWLSKLLDVPHVWHIREMLDERHLVVSLFDKKYHYKYIVKNSDMLILISDALMRHYSEFNSSIKRVRIYDDVSPKYIVNEISDWEKCKYNLLIAGNISRGKGQHIAIRALSEIKKMGFCCSLFIAGVCDKSNQDYFHELKLEIECLGLNDDVFFLGNVENMNQLRSKTGIGIVAAKNEAFGRVTIEGMLAGMVIVGADDGGTAELINDSKNGFLFPADDFQYLAKKIVDILNMENNVVGRIRSNARKYALKYTRGDCARAVASEMQKLVK